MTRMGFGPTLDRTIASTPRAPAEARRAFEELVPEIENGMLRDVQLLVSELVTNSVRHSGSDEPIRLRAWAKANTLKVEIVDGGFGFEPAGPGAAGADEGGRGLMILEALTERWGVACDATTRVWFELAQRPRTGRHAQAG